MKGTAMTNDEKQKLYRSFQEKFPKDRLSSMTLEQYTGIDNKDTFCYWLEHATQELGSIKGRNASKFGIYRFKKNQIIQNLKMTGNMSGGNITIKTKLQTLLHWCGITL